MGKFRKLVVGLVMVALLGVFGGLESTQAQMGADPAHHWVLKAQRPVVIGGYGDNFNYDGSNVRPLNGFATIDIDSAAKTGIVVANIQTTPESGPLYIAQTTKIENGVKKVTHEYLEGNIRLEMHVGDAARFQEFEWLHGNTGNEAPVMPDLFNFLAGWAPIDIYVNDELAYEGLGGHIMYSEQARREDGTIRREDGTLYSPKLQDKSRFTIPGGRELHVVAHTTVPDPDNFPPHTHWLHLVFFDVFAQHLPNASGAVGSAAVGQASLPPVPVSGAPAQVGQNNAPVQDQEQPAQARQYVVLMRNEGGRFFFDPPGLRVAPGDTVTWLNLGDNHSTTAYAPPNRAGGSVSPQRIPDGAAAWDSGILGIQDRPLSFSHTFEVEGTYDYFCLPHEFLGMVGRIVVGQPGGPADSAGAAGLSDSAQEVLAGLPVERLMGDQGTAFDAAANINRVLLQVFENQLPASIETAQRLLDETDALAPLLGERVAEFRSLLDQYLSLTRSQAGFGPLSQAADALKTLLGTL